MPATATSLEKTRSNGAILFDTVTCKEGPCKIELTTRSIPILPFIESLGQRISLHHPSRASCQVSSITTPMTYKTMLPMGKACQALLSTTSILDTTILKAAWFTKEKAILIGESFNAPMDLPPQNYGTKSDQIISNLYGLNLVDFGYEKTSGISNLILG